MQFLNRTDEVAMLRARLSSGGAEFLVVYGRRRVGKTELLAHLAASTRSVYYEATDTVVADQLRDLTAELARSSGDEMLTMQPLTTWESALAAIARVVGSRRTMVVLDEFQLLAAQSPELETTLSRWWRTTGRRLPITLVLAGSELSFFEDSVLAGSLYGRRTGGGDRFPPGTGAEPRSGRSMSSEWTATAVRSSQVCASGPPSRSTSPSSTCSTGCSRT